MLYKPGNRRVQRQVLHMKLNVSVKDVIRTSFRPILALTLLGRRDQNMVLDLRTMHKVTTHGVHMVVSGGFTKPYIDPISPGRRICSSRTSRSRFTSN